MFSMGIVMVTFALNIGYVQILPQYYPLFFEKYANRIHHLCSLLFLWYFRFFDERKIALRTSRPPQTELF